MKKATLRFFAILSVTAILVLAGFSAFSNHSKPVTSPVADGLQFFNGNLEQGLAAARTENKNVFVIVHASWCPACKKMKKNVIPQQSLGDVFNKNFINVAVDYDSEAGKAIREKYGISGTPGLLFLDAEGKLLSHATGFKSTQELINLAKPWHK